MTRLEIWKTLWFSGLERQEAAMTIKRQHTGELCSGAIILCINMAVIVGIYTSDKMQQYIL